MTDTPGGSKLSAADLLSNGPRVVNVGLSRFAEDLRAAGVPVADVAWTPPASADARVLDALDRVTGADPELTERVEAANAAAIERMLAADPVLVDVRPAADVVPGLEDRMILHAGPPVEWERMCGPMRGAVAGAIVLEGWASDLEAASALAAAGGIRFAPNHHHDAVGPMTGLTTRTMPVMVVENRAFGNRAYCAVNEGLGKVMRFGGNDESVLDRLRWLATTLGPLLGEALRAGDGVLLKALVARGLSMGDEMHQRNVACTSLLLRALAPSLARTARDSALLGETLEFIGGNDQFFLNVAMAMGKAIMDPVRGVDGASIVTAMSRNGTDFGVRLSGTGERWFTAPVEMPRGLYFPGFTAGDANPDMGGLHHRGDGRPRRVRDGRIPCGGGVRGGGGRERGAGGDPRDVRDHRGAEPGMDDSRPGFRRGAGGHRRAQRGGERARADHQHRHRSPRAGCGTGGGRNRERAARLLRAGVAGARRADRRSASRPAPDDDGSNHGLMTIGSELRAPGGVTDPSSAPVGRIGTGMAEGMGMAWTR